MSRAKPRPMEKLALEYRCEFCGAKPFRWCVTARGQHAGENWATFLHVNRNGPIYDAWTLGYTEYEDYMVELTQEQLQAHFQFLQRIKARRERMAS